jgi:hypothetical protein
MPKKNDYEDLTGRVFSHLTVIRLEGRKCVSTGKYPKLLWRCRCSCGKEIVTIKYPLIAGKTKSCGCQRGLASGKWAKENLTTHGMKGTPEWVSWLEMRRRCRSPKWREAHKNYVQRGITVCKRWDSFQNFYNDMGPKPDRSYSIERKDNTKGYSPSNCKWASRKEQNRNRSNTRFLEIDGVTKPVSQWAEETGISYWTLLSRSKKQL